MLLPAAVLEFLRAPYAFSCLELPNNYACAGQFALFQIGYRVHGITAEDLTGAAAKSFPTNAYVIASNALADPFVIYFDQEPQGFPVYFARHGQGVWHWQQISPSLCEFSQILAQLQTLEDTPEAMVRFLQAQNLQAEYWQELEQTFSEMQEDAALDDELSHIDPSLNLQDWQQMRLIITDLGANKLPVVKFIKDRLQISLSQALALSKNLPLELEQGAQRWLNNTAQDLQALGASVELQVIA